MKKALDIRTMDMRFYFITDCGLTVNGIISDVEDALRAGARVIQYRDKNAPTRKMYEIGRRIGEICRNYDAIYLVNDRIDVAIATDAHGVHIGQEDMPLQVAREMMPDGIIGVSCASVEEALEAVNGGADYLGVGPVFVTSTKKDAGVPIGLDGLEAVVSAIPRPGLPVVAIGGITLDNVEDVIKAGADTVSAISATVGPRVYHSVGVFIERIRKAKENEG